ncbi:efflux RND transporter permease subunit [Photorhabdus stackebrandtii]|uniref:RND transporter n=1 Tax=Photorhabdus stackebrandtii TaxID=1123042 RepID=A0A7X5TLF3_9GAMM|nr:efflux RND transporter permease subunit [Photorhabdus stackebrandtii]NHB96618.1 RND transporter [Photorhabdus stackebrandtii]
MKSSNWVDNAASGYARWVVKRRYLNLILVCIVLFFTFKGMENLAFTSSYKVFFSRENPFLNAYESMQKTYSNGDSALIVLAPKDGNVFSKQFLSIVEKLTKDAWQVPNAYRVDSITNFQATKADDDSLEIRKLVPDAAELTERDLVEIRKIALNEPLLVKRIISENGDVTAVNVSVRLPDGDDKIVAEVAGYVRQLKSRYTQMYPDIDIYLTGIAMMSNAFPEISVQEMSTTIPIVFLIVLILSFLVLRSFSATFVVCLVIVFSIISALGAAGYMGIKLTQVSANVPVIVMTLAVVDSIHILVTVIHRMKLGDSQHEAIVESLRVNLSPVVITSVTTAVGFLGLNLSDAPPFHDLGNMTAIGMGAALFFATFLLPALLAVLPIRVKLGVQRKQFSIEFLADWVIDNRRKLLVSTVTFGLIMLAFIPRLTVDENFVKNFAKGLEIRDDSDFTQDHLTGLFNMEFSLGAGKEGGINEPEYMAKVDEFANWSRAQLGVMNVNVITDTVKRINQSMNGDDAAYYRLPTDRETIAQYLLLYEMSLPLGLDLNDQIDVSRSATKMTATFSDLSTFEMQRAKEAHEQWLINNASPSMHTNAASASLMYTYLMNTNIKGLLAGTAISFLIITICLGVVFRSTKYALISMLPNILPIFMAFGLWSIIDGVVGIAAATIATMTLGIVVDDTVYFVYKYLRARREHKMDSKDAVRYSFSTVGIALLSTSIIFICGFGSMMHSDFLMNAQMGIFTVMTVTFALLFDFLLLPILLIAIDGNAKKNKPSIPDDPLMMKI